MRPVSFLRSPIHGLLQIAPLLANESLEGCAPAIALFRRHYSQCGFKELGETITGARDSLPAWIALDISKKPTVYRWDPNGLGLETSAVGAAEVHVPESGLDVCFDVSVDVDSGNNRPYPEYIVKQCLLAPLYLYSILLQFFLFLPRPVICLCPSKVTVMQMILWLIKNPSSR